MSMHAREVLDWLDEAEDQIEWWGQYADRLTPAEIRDFRKGIFNAFHRPLEPAFGDDTWLRITDNFRVHVSSVRPYKGRWRCVVDQVEDFRAHHVHMRPVRDHSDTLENTIILLRSPDLREPEGIDPDRIKDGASQAISTALYEREQENRRRAYAELPVAERLAALKRLAAAAHVDTSAEERVIERALTKLERKVVETTRQRAA